MDLNEAEVEVVPYIWLIENNSKCYWPNLKSSDRISNLVSNRAVPNEKWKIYDVRRVFGSYENYLEARKKANLAVDTSDINTDHGKRKRRLPKKLLDEKIPTKKLKKVKKLIPSDSSEDESSEMETIPMTPPKFNLRPENHSSTRVLSSTAVTKKNIYSTIAQLTSGSPHASMGNPTDSVQNGASGSEWNEPGSFAVIMENDSATRALSSPSVTKKPLCPAAARWTLPRPYASMGNPMDSIANSPADSEWEERGSLTIRNESDFETRAAPSIIAIKNNLCAMTVPSTSQGPSLIMGNLLDPIASSPAGTESDKRGSDFERQMKREMFGIKTRLTQIETTLNLIVSQISSKFAEPPVQFAFRLPCTSLEELNDLNDTLEAESSKQQLITFFRILGGSCTADMTRRILRKVMTDQVASMMNWKGQHGKHSFETTRVAALIISAVQAFYGDGNVRVNSKLVESTAKEWLKQASNRLKQKSSRAKASKTPGSASVASPSCETD